MKNTIRMALLAALGLLLAACGPLIFSTQSSVPAATQTEIAVERGARPSPSATLTATVEPSPSASDATKALPTVEAWKIPGLLKTALTVESLEPFHGHSLRRVTGWNDGFQRFEWMDDHHLMLHPIIRYWITDAFGRLAEYNPVVINLSTKNAWNPPPNDRPMMHYFLDMSVTRWSSQLGILISSDTETPGGRAILYDAEGNFIKSYPGKLAAISPSATKILMSDDRWIDLSSGKTVQFTWDQDIKDFAYALWSPDETGVYVCCYLYGDAKTGKSLSMPRNNITLDGKELGASPEDSALFNTLGTWVLNDRFLLSQWDEIDDSRPDFIFLFDPAEKTYHNLNKLAGIPAEFGGGANCRSTSAINGGRYIWAICFDAEHLIDLATFKSWAYPDMLQVPPEWSADGQFAWIDAYEQPLDHPIIRILAVESKKLTAVPAIEPSPAWHPTEDVLAYLSKKGQTLSFLDVHSMKARDVTLPVPIRELAWSPTGERLALEAQDSSVWQIDYPSLENLEQLTPALPGETQPAFAGGPFRVSQMTWSPDGSSLGFFGDKDIYIVEVQSAP